MQHELHLDIPHAKVRIQIATFVNLTEWWQWKKELQIWWPHCSNNNQAFCMCHTFVPSSLAMPICQKICSTHLSGWRQEQRFTKNYKDVRLMDDQSLQEGKLPLLYRMLHLKLHMTGIECKIMIHYDYLSQEYPENVTHFTWCSIPYPKNCTQEESDPIDFRWFQAANITY